MAIKIYTGLPGNGKSLGMASEAVDMLYENKKNGLGRKVYSNLKFSEDVEKEFEGLIEYWNDARELALITKADIIWEEMSAYCDATQWQNMPSELKRFIKQHRHRQVRIIGNVQEFSDIDISVRRVTDRLIYMMKLAGSPDPYENMPPVKHIWGIILKLNINPRNYKEDKKFSGIEISSFGGFEFITKKKVGIFDMFNDIKSQAHPPLKHIERDCEEKNCHYHKVIHI